MAHLHHKLLILLALSAVAAVAAEERTLYRWVDEDGVIHISDEQPPEGIEAEVIGLPLGPPRQAFPDPPAPAKPIPVPLRKEPPDGAAAPPSAPPPSVEKSPAEMTLDELDRRCESAREERIAPLREAEIARCQDERPRSEAAWCVRYYADFGEGSRTVSGGYRPRMFADLPECEEAAQERRRRLIN